MDNRKLVSIAMFAILATSSFTFLGAYPFMNLIPQAEAQGLQLRVSVAENPAFENHFFGAMIVQIIIDDPGATDPDESTVGLVILGNTAGRVHLSDGLWYAFMAEDESFSILLDVLTDGERNNVIRVSKAVSDNPGLGCAAPQVLPLPAACNLTFTIGGVQYAVDPGENDSFVAEIGTGSGGLPHIELNQADIFTILPQPFFENQLPTANVINPDLRIGPAEVSSPGAGTAADGDCTALDGGGGAASAGGLSTGAGGAGLANEGDQDCDWPYVRLVGLEELDTAEVRAGTASVVLTFDDLAESIAAKLDRVTDYPLNAEVIFQFTDFMYNLNPVEEDGAFFVLDTNTGRPNRIINNIVPGLDPARDGPNFFDIFPIFTLSSPGLEFDERQVLELDAPEGVNVIRFIHVFDVSRNAIGTFVEEPFTRISENARLVSEFDDPGTTIFVDLNGDGDADDAGEQEAGTVDDLPVIRMFETDPNTNVMISTVEPQGGRSVLFTGVNDRVASFDYFDIINSAPMTTHDGFTSVDREVYDSADRAVFTVTDPDQNLRSRISEEPSGRDSSSLIRVGNPFPLVNTNPVNGISNPTIDNVIRAWEAIFMWAGDGVVDADDLTFGADGGAGANVLADVDDDNVIEIGTGVGTIGVEEQGTERFHADDDDIEPLALEDNNRRFALAFTSDGIGPGSDSANAIIVDTSLRLSDIDDVVTLQLTGEEILNHVRVDNLQDLTLPACGPPVVDPGCPDPTEDQIENFLVNVAEIIGPAGIVGVADGTGIAPGTTYTVRLPRYNLVNLDITDLQADTNIGDVVVKIDAVDEDCITDAAIGAAAAFDPACVHASQIVDFGLLEGTVTGVEPIERDTDASEDSGDQWSDAVKDVADAPVAEGGIDSWSSDIVDGIEAAGGDFETGFDRDPLAGRVSVGSFRVLDLIRVAEANNAATEDALTDRIRMTVLLLAPANVPGFAVDEPIETIALEDFQVVVLDIVGLGIGYNRAPINAQPDRLESTIGNTFSNLAYRLELDEEGSNSSIFTGRADYMTFNQFDTVTDILGEIVLTGDPLKLWMPNRFIPPNRLAFVNLDEDIVQFFREVSATFIYETRDGSIEWDRGSFSFGQDAFLTLTDEDLNRRPDATERYNLPLDSFVFFELGKVRVDTTCEFGDNACFLNNIDATLLETGPNTGTFVSQITMPRSIFTVANTGANLREGGGDDIAPTVTQQEDLEANYIDIRDRSSVRQEFDDITNIRTTLGDVVLDRAAYPPGALMYIEIHDNDFNTDVDIRETIDLRQLVATVDTNIGGAIEEGTQFGPVPGVAPGGVFPAACTAPAAGLDLTTLIRNGACDDLAPILEVTIFQTGVGRLATLLPVGLLDVDLDGVPGPVGNQAFVDRFGAGLDAGVVLPMLTRDGVAVEDALETGPNTGIFEFEVRLPGPGEDPQAFPIDLPDVLTSGDVDDPDVDANQPIQVTYFDPADESGEAEDEEELATFLFNTARLRTDKLEYGLGEPVEIIIEEPDFNIDSRSIDEIEFTILDVITDKFDTEDEDAAIADFSEVVDAVADLRTNLTVFRETGFNTGVFVVQIEEIVEEFVDRGEDVELIYSDQTPSGGGAEIRIEYEFLVVEILPEIIFDKEEYTPFDEFIVSIISPDSNQDPDRIETIRPLVSSSSDSIGRQSFPETGPNTGIFEEDFDLTPDEDRFPGDLRAVREDGVTVEFRIDEDTVATKSVFINYHVGQVMFDKDAFRISERGVLRVIDPDANRNPDTIDITSVRFWSTTDRGGLQVNLRETGDRTGIFEEIITFTPDEESTGTRLRVSEGDTITAKFTDNTLPAPAALDVNEVFTVEIEELFASALIGAVVPPLERAVASEPQLVDQTGAELTDVSVGSQVLIQSEITNSQTKKQPFAYIVQIKDENGVTISLSWVTGELPAKESLKAAQSWIPDAKGDFTVEIFVWESVDKPVALSPVRTTTVSVT